MPGADCLGSDQLRAQFSEEIQISEPMGRFDVQHRYLAYLRTITRPMRIPGEQTFKRGNHNMLWRRQKCLLNMGAAFVGRQAGIRHNFTNVVLKTPTL